ncbi:hypothetical protein EOL70_10995 [Leucothrix sargassi]|nr:hypothetical protein EOL70_10995 [Leucothrix sargassi]
MVTSSVLADSFGPPTSYSELTKNNKYVFVMLVPGSWDRTLSEYKRSGLYKNGSLKPEWLVNWYADGVSPNSDGKHLIRHGPWASVISQEAFSFFKNGKLIKSYKISDLVKDESKLLHSVSHIEWSDDMHYFEDEGVLYVKTIDQHKYVISIYSGEMIAQNNRQYLEIIEKVEQKNLVEAKEKYLARQPSVRELVRKVSEALLQRLPMKFTPERAEKVYYYLVEGEDEETAFIWKMVKKHLVASNKVIEKTVGGKRYYQKLN